jgi:L-threonylcarbamoyladenylate synthase
MIFLIIIRGMKIINIKDQSVFAQVKAVLTSGFLLMHPTETCYGLAVDVHNEAALVKLYAAKGMPKDKPVSILVDSLEMAQEYGEFSDLALDLAQKHWPGPLSILVPRKEKLPGFFNPGHDFVSIRFSSDAFCARMVEDLGRPVTTTSANRSGEHQFYKAKEMDGVDLTVDAGQIPENQPSTIVRVDGDQLEIMRQGLLEV